MYTTSFETGGSMKLNFLLILISSLFISNIGLAGADPSHFPFFERPIRFRFHQGFFQHAGDVVENLLKTAKIIESIPGQPVKGILKIPTDSGQTHVIYYNSLKPSFSIQNNKLITRIQVDIEKSIIYAQPNDNCYVDLNGKLSFQVETILNNSGKAQVSLNQGLYNDSGISYVTQNCSFFMKMGISAMIKDKLETGIKDGFNEVFNNQELKYIDQVNFGKKLLERNIIVNQPLRNTYYTKSELHSLPSQLKMELGFLGYLSNNKMDKMIQIQNPQNQYVNQVGLDWAFSAGFRALSRNIEDPNFSPLMQKDGSPFPLWGETPAQQLGAPLSFDAGIMIKESFLKNLFATLYQAGFFNLQVQESLILSPEWSINPLQRTDLFHVVLPNGEMLNKANYQDSRLTVSFSDPPHIEFKENSLRLEISRLRMKYSVKTQAGEELPIVDFIARLSVTAAIELEKNGNISLSFNDKPVQNFMVLERSGVAKDLSNSDIHQILNTDISQILKGFNLELPLVAGKKAKLKFLGISETPSAQTNTIDKALSIYLDIAEQ